MTNQQIISLILGFGAISFILFLLFYGLTSICYQKFFKAYGYANPLYAWIPFYRVYILADLTSSNPFVVGGFSIPKKVFVWWWVISYVIAFIPLAGGFLSLLIEVICLGYCHHEGIKKLDPSYDGKVLSYLSSLFHIILWVIVLPKKTD